MSNEILILTLLPEKGTTGVQSHFNALSDYLTENNINNKILTPYTYGLSFFERILRKIIFKIIKKIDKEQSIIFIHELLIRRLRKNLLKYIKNNVKSYYIYAQDPSTALLACNLKNDFKDFKFIKISLMCHFNISEIYEYIVSEQVSDTGKLYSYLSKNEVEACRTVDKIIFPTKFSKNNVLKRLTEFSIDLKTTVISNFLEDHQSTPSLNDDEIDFISIGTLEARKNQEFSLRIISELHKLGHKRRLTFVGDGPDRVKLERLASELNITDYITFLGYVENAKELLISAKFLLHTPKMEAFGIVLIEAMSYGIPVCVTPVGGVPEVFDDGDEGVYLDFKDPKKSAEMICVFFNDRIYYDMSRNARKRFEEKFTTQKIAPLFFNEIIGK